VILQGSGATYGSWAGVFASIKFAIAALTLPWLLLTSITYVLLKRKTHSA
jgi:hypothetical protein